MDQILDLHHEKSTGDQFKRARNIIKDFAVKALRENQPSAKFVDALLEIFKRQLKIDKDFDIAIRKPLSIILASPGFIYLNEPGQEGKPRSLSDRELAVRLSYFLWSLPPDDRLISLAKKRVLRNPKVLRQEVERMIKDPKAHTLSQVLYINGWTWNAWIYFSLMGRPSVNLTKTPGRLRVKKYINHFFTYCALQSKAKSITY